jgi:hypothetical protein
LGLEELLLGGPAEARTAGLELQQRVWSFDNRFEALLTKDQACLKPFPHSSQTATTGAAKFQSNFIAVEASKSLLEASKPLMKLPSSLNQLAACQHKAPNRGLACPSNPSALLPKEETRHFKTHRKDRRAEGFDLKKIRSSDDAEEWSEDHLPSFL